jgi:hypothetical protein
LSDDPPSLFKFIVVLVAKKVRITTDLGLTREQQEYSAALQVPLSGPASGAEETQALTLSFAFFLMTAGHEEEAAAGDGRERAAARQRLLLGPPARQRGHCRRRHAGEAAVERTSGADCGGSRPQLVRAKKQKKKKENKKNNKKEKEKKKQRRNKEREREPVSRGLYHLLFLFFFFPPCQRSLKIRGPDWRAADASPHCGLAAGHR